MSEAEYELIYHAGIPGRGEVTLPTLRSLVSQLENAQTLLLLFV